MSELEVTTTIIVRGANAKDAREAIRQACAASADAFFAASESEKLVGSAKNGNRAHLRAVPSAHVIPKK